MTTTAFAAHIVTSEAGMGDPAVIIMTDASEDGQSHELATYPLDADNPADVLSEHGWRMVSDPAPAGRGYTIAMVVASDTTCQWFLMCDNPATRCRQHPILGAVPICDRCAEKTDRLAQSGGKSDDQ